MANAAEGTRHIWVDEIFHLAAALESVERQQTIRVTVERRLLSGYGYNTIAEFRQALLTLHGVKTVEELKKKREEGKAA